MEDAVEKARIRAEKSAGLLKNAYVGQKLEETENCKVILLFDFSISRFSEYQSIGAPELRYTWLNKFAESD